MILQENGAARNRGITLASIKGIIGNVVLVIFKMIVGFASNSIAIILDAVNNFNRCFVLCIDDRWYKISSQRGR